MGMPLSFIGPIIDSAAKTVSAGGNIWTGNKYADALKRGQATSRADISKGYGEAQGFQKPIYDTGVGAYTGLGNEYAAGGFNTNQNWNPQSVFTDPEYKAAMESGVAGINSGAEAKGNLFSTANQRNLMDYGQNIYAGRSDALYGRQAEADKTRFNEGMGIAQPGFGAANNRSTMAIGLGEELAGNDLGSAQIRAGNIANTGKTLTGLNDANSKNAQSMFSFNSMLGKGK